MSRDRWNGTPPRGKAPRGSRAGRRDEPNNASKPRMPRHGQRLSAGVLALALISVVMAGCGGGSSTSTTSAAQTASSTPAATVQVAARGFGQILFNSAGRTLYLFSADSGTTSACSHSCAAAWPPLLVTGKPTVGSGGDPSLIGTTKRSNGATQVTYHGHPLYLFADDKKAGDTNGEDVNAFGAPWYVLSPAGGQITGPSIAPGTGSTGPPAGY
jgi:predicted lipoprotein with Yx(FWY)xxD motif